MTTTTPAKKRTVRDRIEKFLFPATTELFSAHPNDGPFMGLTLLFQFMMLPWVFLADMVRLLFFACVAGAIIAACYYGAHHLHWV